MARDGKGLLGNSKFFPVYWIALTALALAADYVAGPVIQFPILYLIPVSLASWYSGRWWGLALACTMPLVRVGMVAVWAEPSTMMATSINAAVRVAVLAGYALLTDRVAVQTRALAQEVRVLGGLLPICSFCRRIRDENNQWQPLEWYVSQRSEAQFSHTFCPECGREHYGEYVDETYCVPVMTGGGENAHCE